MNEATLKVDAGEVGEMTPRYLEFEKLEGKADLVKKGDRLTITFNNKNAVVDYHLDKENHSGPGVDLLGSRNVYFFPIFDKAIVAI